MSEGIDNTTATEVVEQTLDQEIPENITNEDSVNESVASESEPEQETQEEQVERIKKLLLKVDGEEIEEELPFEVDPEHAEYLKKELQMSRAAQKRMAEAATIRKEFDSILEQVKSGDAEILQKLGLNVDDFVNQFVENKLKEAELSPEERKIQELEKALADKEAREKELEEARQAEESQRIQQEIQLNIENEIADLLDGDDILGPNPYFAKRIIDKLIDAHDMGLQATPSQIFPIVKEEILGEFQQMGASLDSSRFEKLYGKPTLEKLRKERLDQLRKAAPAATKKKVVDTAANSEAPETEEKKINMKDWLRNKVSLSDS